MCQLLDTKGGQSTSRLYPGPTQVVLYQTGVRLIDAEPQFLTTMMMMMKLRVVKFQLRRKCNKLRADVSACLDTVGRC